MTSVKQYLTKISGVMQSIEPEQGRTSIGGIKFTLLDVDGEITALIGADDYQMQNKTVTIKAGYAGLDYDDYVTVMLSGQVSRLKMNRNLTAWEFDCADVAKWTQRKIFRGATDAAPVSIEGNPINILMNVLTSTGAGTNGTYDWLDETDGLGIDESLVNISNMEAVRDAYYPGDSAYLKFSITERIKSKEWIEQEICKPLNMYWFINGSGQIDIVPFKAPFSESDLESFDQDDIIGDPEYDANFDALINEVEFSYNWDGDEYGDISYHADATSITNRGAGKNVLEIKSKGIDTDIVGADFITRRKNRVFSRYADPPPKIRFETFFYKWPIEVGQIVKFSHPRMPDLSDGTFGLTDELMEVVRREPDWDRGRVKWELLYTGFVHDNYGMIAPTGTVVTGSSGTEFTMSEADCAKFTAGWEVLIHDSGGRVKGAHVTITDITGTTVTIDDLGETPVAGDKVRFADYDDCAALQQSNYMFVQASGKNIY